MNIKKVIPGKGMVLLPPKPDTCQECASKHEPDQPHSKGSLYYQYAFRAKHGRWPTWTDAIAHCSEEVKQLWIEELGKKGIVMQEAK